MLFNSYIFILGFLPPVLVLYWLFRHSRPGLANLVVALGSYVFYISGETTYPWLLAASVVFNYWIGQRIQGTALHAKRWLVVGLVGDLAALAYFKYFNFITSIIGDFGLIQAPMAHVVLPIGISFFTFTQIAYLVDLYHGKASRSDPVSYSLFVTFFPHLIAGPILHHSEMMPQFARRDLGRLVEHFPIGLSMFAIGLFKKTMIADSVAPVVNALFDEAQSGGSLTLLPAWIAVLAYAVQIYFDFSGYSDMAIGLARMLGIDLPINFNSPYKAISIADFWRRWHITLSRFLRDYVYIALGGNRRGEPRRYFNLGATMLLGGIWHGAGWTFVLWGALHGGYLILEHLLGEIRRRLHLPAPPATLGRMLTLLLVLIAWVPFRAPNLATTLAIWRGMFGFSGVALPGVSAGAASLAAKLGLATETVPFNRTDVLFILSALVACLILPNSQQILSRARIGLDSPGYQALATPARRRFLWRLTPSWAIAMGLVLGLAVRTIGGYSQFIYFQF